jgi:serine/threonine-protein kinase
MSDSSQTLDDFLRVLRASGLVDAGKIDQALAPWMDTEGRLPLGAEPVPEGLVAALIESGQLTPWQVDQLRKGRHKGFVLGKYKLLRLLGAGGMSSVYLAEHATLHHKVAIKVLPVKRVDQSSYLARFEREAQSSARLNHPNIARAFDLESSGAIHFIVLEYIDGTDLYAKVKREGPLDVREVAEYLRQAATGLQYAHDEGLVHRDIKPANLMLDKRGTVKILDMGLALANGDEAGSLTREHDEKVLGTADYLAPEQARDSHKADRRSDVYSLGCSLYFLLVGRAPFANGPLAERLRAHMNEPAPNLLEKRPDVPTAIAELYFRMMEKHPDARPQTAQEVADALAAWLGSTPTGPRPAGRLDPPRRAPRRGSGEGSATPGPRRQPGQVVRSGPGSTSGPLGSSGVLGSGSGSGSLPDSGRSGPESAAPSGVQGLPRIDTSSSPTRKGSATRAGGPPSAPQAKQAKQPAASKATATDPADEPSRPKIKTSWTDINVLGLPIVFWILFVAGIGAAVALAIAVLRTRA